MSAIRFLKRRRLLVLSVVLVISIALVFSACKGTAGSTETSGEDAEAAATGEIVTLTLWDWHSGEIPDVVKPLYAQFEEEFNLKVNEQNTLKP